MRSAVLLVALAAGCGDNRAVTSPDAGAPLVPIAKVCPPGDPLSMLVLTRQTYWNHPCNPVAASAIQSLAAARGWRADVAGDPIVVTEDQLTRTDVIVFSVTSGDILDDTQRALLERFFGSGGGYAGTHSAIVTEPDWPFYSHLMPVAFKNHPPAFEGTVTIEAPGDVLDAGLPAPWVHFDEYYAFTQRPETLGVRPLLAFDEAASPDYPADLRVGYHPIAWTYEGGGVPAFFTALGHPVEAYSDPLFLATLEHGIAWAGAAHYAARCGTQAAP